MPWALLAATLGVAFAGFAEAVKLPIGYDTVWVTQSQNSSGSMPLGGGDVGLNVWAESGSIYFYIAQSGAFDENNSLLKLGRVQLQIKPNPFKLNASIFEQRLFINDGYIKFTGDHNTTVMLWVDVNSSNVHVEIDSDRPVKLTAGLHSWRTSGYQMVANEQLEFYKGVGVLSYHHNYLFPLFDFQAKQQGLPDPNSFFNPMRNNTFGSYMFSPQLKAGSKTKGRYLNTNFTSFNLVSAYASKNFQLYIGTNQQQTLDVDAWKRMLITKTIAMTTEAQDASIAWWHDNWDRSYILINPAAPGSDPGFQVGKNYQYFRYMMGCNAKGEFPMRFNGGFFTFDPVLTDENLPFTPDYRKWSGGTFTAQNQRLLYWPLLKTGDWDIMQQEFNYYEQILPNSRKLGRFYFGIDASLTSEQIDNTGLPNVYEYNYNLYNNGEQRNASYPTGIDFNSYISWLQDTANEFADMVLLYHSVYGLPIAKWMPFVEYQLAWFDEFYRKRNGLNKKSDKLVLYPASGCETYKMALDPASTVSGLYRTITDLLESGLQYVKGNQSYYEQYRRRVPATPTRPCPGSIEFVCIAPARNYSFTENTELVSLYPVFPWSEYGLGQPTPLEYAYNAYFYDEESSSFHGTDGWRQDQIWWARMGLTDLVTNNTISRLSDSTTYRFSAFKGPNYDWSPDLNHYGSAAIGLQEMILQTFALNNTQIRLIPAFPTNWTGSFKLLGPRRTVVEGILTGRSIENLSVRPTSRMSDVVWGNGTV